MPSKHIDNELWKQIQEKHIQMVIETKTSLNDTDVLKAIIKKGLDVITNDDVLKNIKKKNKHRKEQSNERFFD